LTGDLSAVYAARDSTREKAGLAHQRRTVGWAALATLVVMIALVAAPAAPADECLPENGCIPGEVAPPVPPDEAGDPQPVTISSTQIPDVPPAVTYPAPPYSAPKKCKKKHHRATARKKCHRKHH
jgi:hypothetical protein